MRGILLLPPEEHCCRRCHDNREITVVYGVVTAYQWAFTLYRRADYPSLPPSPGDNDYQPRSNAAVPKEKRDAVFVRHAIMRMREPNIARELVLVGTSVPEPVVSRFRCPRCMTF